MAPVQVASAAAVGVGGTWVQGCSTALEVWPEMGRCLRHNCDDRPDVCIIDSEHYVSAVVPTQRWLRQGAKPLTPTRRGEIGDGEESIIQQPCLACIKQYCRSYQLHRETPP